MVSLLVQSQKALTAFLSGASPEAVCEASGLSLSQVERIVSSPLAQAEAARRAALRAEKEAA